MSYYPDGTTHPNWRPEVVVSRKQSLYVLRPEVVKAVVCHRNSSGNEEYLVKWAGKWGNAPPFSWHDLSELRPALRKVQAYIDGLHPPAGQTLDLPKFSKKRKSPGSDDVVGFTSSSDRVSPAISISSGSSASSLPDPDASSYNCKVIRKDGLITVEQNPDGTRKRDLPTQAMMQRASKTGVRQAMYHIRAEFNRRLALIPGPPVSVRNDIDDSTPTLKFLFVSDNSISEGVEVAAQETVIGCGHVRKPGVPNCKPDMGQGIGCEYLAACECMEYAAVDETKLVTPDQKKKFEDGNYEGLPRRFPYYSTARRSGCLMSHYLSSRATIYECNATCNCGPNCKTRVVQKGRRVPLEIFKTKDRGWGLRTKETLQKGQFIDTYRGEIITNEVANRREERAKKEEEKNNKHKAIYLYNLDKFVGEGGVTEDNCYVIDGEYVGGPTRYINHSCEPNCRQYVVSYNKSDLKVYTMAFFAYQNIPAGSELTFDYLDKDDVELIPGSSQDIDKNDMEGAMTMNCLCGSESCRGKLFI